MPTLFSEYCINSNSTFNVLNRTLGLAVNVIQDIFVLL